MRYRSDRCLLYLAAAQKYEQEAKQRLASTFQSQLDEKDERMRVLESQVEAFKVQMAETAQELQKLRDSSAEKTAQIAGLEEQVGKLEAVWTLR